MVAIEKEKGAFWFAIFIKHEGHGLVVRAFSIIDWIEIILFYLPDFIKPGLPTSLQDFCDKLGQRVKRHYRYFTISWA